MFWLQSDFDPAHVMLQEIQGIIHRWVDEAIVAKGLPKGLSSVSVRLSGSYRLGTPGPSLVVSVAH